MKRPRANQLFLIAVVSITFLVDVPAGYSANAVHKSAAIQKPPVRKSIPAAAQKPGAVEALESGARAKMQERKFADALADFQHALVLREKAGNAEPAACDLANVAVLQCRLNSFDEASENAGKAYAKLQAASTKAAKEGLATSMSALGLVAANKGEVENAREELDGALKLEEQMWGAKDVRLADGLIDMAKVEQSQGLNTDAEQALQRALSLREQSLGTQSPLVESVLDDYAELLTVMDRKSEAAQLRQRSRMIHNEAKGGSAEVTSGNSLWSKYMSQGQEQFMAGRKADAKASYKLALDEAEKGGENGPKVPATLIKLATISQSDQDWKSAEPYLLRAKTILEGTDSDSDLMSQCLQQLSTGYSVQGHEKDAYSSTKQALAIMEKTSKPDDPRLDPLMLQLGVAAMRMKSLDEAAQIFQKLVERAQGNGGDTKKRGQYMAMLGSVYMQQGKQDKGLQLMKEASQLMK